MIAIPNNWMWRVWFGGLLMIGCEIIFWRSPLDRPLVDWLRLAIGYGVMGAIGLDVLARYRVRDLAGVMGTTLFLAPLIALVLTSENTLISLPMHLFSRVLGLHGIGVLWAVGVWVCLWDKSYLLRWIGVGCLLFGILTALWLRVADHFINWSLSPAYLIQAMLIYALVGGLIGAGGYLARQSVPKSDEMMLSPLEWSVILLMSLGLILWGDTPDRQAIGGTVILSAWGLLIVWFEHDVKSLPLLDRLFAQSPPNMSRIIVLWLIGGIGLALGWFIPLRLETGLSPINLMENGIVLFGFGWMPCLTLWVAVRALSRRSWRLDID
jgi:hypothetical protein